MKFLVIYVAKMHSLWCLHPPDISAMAWERTNWTLGNSPPMMSSVCPSFSPPSMDIFCPPSLFFTFPFAMKLNTLFLEIAVLNLKFSPANIDPEGKGEGSNIQIEKCRQYYISEEKILFS